MNKRDENMLKPCIILFFTVIAIYALIVFFFPNLFNIGELANVSQILGFFLALIMSCLAIKGFDRLKIEIGRIGKVEVEVDARGSIFVVPPTIDSKPEEGEINE